MDRLLTIVKKEFRHIYRDPRTMALILLLPAFLLLLLGFGVSGESKQIPLAVVDYSRTEESRAYIGTYTNGEDFAYVYSASSEEELLNLIHRDKVKVGLLIPEDFGRLIATNKSTQVQLYINGSAAPSDIETIQLKLAAISQMASQNILIKQLEVSGISGSFKLPINTNIKMLYNPNRESKMYMIPGLIPIVLQVQLLLLSALAIVKEKEQGTMEQLIVTPIRGWELMLGKIIPYMFVTLVNIVGLIGVGSWIFGVQMRGSFFELVGLSMIFSIGSLGTGVLISNLSDSQMQAVYLAVFIVMIPAIILSGLMYPRDAMPLFTYWFSELMPVTFFLEITRGIMLKGVGSAYLWSSIWPMLLLSVAYFAASVFTFKKKI